MASRPLFLSNKFSTLSVQGYLRTPTDWNSADHANLVLIPHWDIERGMIAVHNDHPFALDNKGWEHSSPRFQNGQFYIPKALRTHFGDATMMITCAGLGDRIELMPKDIYEARLSKSSAYLHENKIWGLTAHPANPSQTR